MDLGRGERGRRGGRERRREGERGREGGREGERGRERGGGREGGIERMEERKGGRDRGKGRKEGREWEGDKRGRDQSRGEGKCRKRTHVGLPHKVLQVRHLRHEGSGGRLACKERLVGGVDGCGHN